jgi:hypothetical protein
MNRNEVKPHIGCPANSPWGQVQEAHALGEGVFAVSTSEHGGIYVPNAILDAMPPALKCNVYGRGNWFEEDVEWALVCVWKPSLFSADHIAAAIRTLMAYASGGAYADAAAWVRRVHGAGKEVVP